jgi:hypothetical protein
MAHKRARTTPRDLTIDTHIDAEDGDDMRTAGVIADGTFDSIPASHGVPGGQTY